MSIDFSSKSTLIFDNGLFVSLAERLVGEFGRVAYFCPWESSFPDGRELIIGAGLAGIDRLKYFWPSVDQFDLFIFPDCWFGDLQEYLRSQGKRVWGGGMGSELELARWKTHERLPDLGLPTTNASHVIGTQALREFLRGNKDQHIKISTFRGIGETWEAKDADFAEGQIRELESKHGAMADVLGFICEKTIKDAKEVGYDGYCIDGEFPETAMFGIEKKDRSYFGKLCDFDDLPPTVLKTLNALWEPLNEFKYRQFFSTEEREKDGKGYIIDLTCRLASPAGEVYTGMFKNLAEIMWHGADGKLVHAESDFKYGAQIILCSEWAEEHWQPMRFPEEIRPYVKIYNHCRLNGMDWCVPQMAKMKQVGSVVFFGNTPEEAVDGCKEIAKQVEGFDLDIEADSLDDAVAEMEELTAEPVAST